MACRRRCAASCVVILLLVVVACGKKGLPLPPIRIVSQRPDQFAVRRLGSQVYLQFVVPTVNTDGSTPADLSVVEVYGVTLDPLPPGVSPLTDEELVEAGTLLAAIDVRPPPLPPEPVDPDAPPPSEDPLLLDVPVQGTILTVREALTEDALVPVDLAEIDRRFERRDDDDEEAERPTITGLRWVPPPLAIPFATPPPRRTYVAVGRTSDGELGVLSPRLTVRLDAAPVPPPVPNVSYTASLVTIRWLAARGATRPVQETVAPPPAAAPDPTLPAVSLRPPPLASTPAIASAEATTYNIYAYTPAPRDAVAAEVMPTPVNVTPLTEFEFADALVAFDVERCYVVRTIAVADGDSVESEASLQTCVVFQDTFPPVAPRSLAAVGASGTVSLIWESNTEDDLAGYLVLRGAAPGDTLQPLMTEPLTETTYRDTTGSPGVAYTYAVVAVDAATPPNVSELSNRVTESPQ